MFLIFVIVPHWERLAEERGRDEEEWLINRRKEGGWQGARKGWR
jgi:hypothetical protein